MNNFIISVKRFFSNKNTVTIIGVILCILVLYIGYNWRINQAISPTRIPYANQTIQPRTLITENMVSYMEVPPSYLKGNYIKSANLIIGKYSNYNTIIPKGSMFFSDSVINERDLPDSAFTNIPTGYTVVNFPVSLTSTYGNSIYPGNYINLYFKAVDTDNANKLIFGKLISNVKVLDVKDSNGKHVFENTNEERTPSSMIFAVPEDIFLLIKKAGYLTKVSAELMPVPNTEKISIENSEEVSSEDIKSFILSKTVTIDIDTTTPPATTE